MEETKRLQAIDGSGCQVELHPSATGETSTRAFLKAFVEVVRLRNDKDYSGLVMHDLQLALMDCGETELARLLMAEELESRRAQLHREQTPLIKVGTLNGGLSAIYDNQEVIVGSELLDH